MEDLLLLDCGDGTPLPPAFASLLPGCQLARPFEVDALDLVIEMAGSLDTAWIDRMRARGTRVVRFGAEQPYTALAEPHVFGRPGPFLRADRCDEVWLLPKDEAHAPLMRTLHRCPVRIAPFIWAPHFVEHRAAELAQHGIDTGWKAPSPGTAWRIGIFEPNQSVTKNCTIPMLGCDMAYRQQRSAIGHMAVYNSVHLASHRTMLHLANALDLVRDHRATFLDRHDTVSILATEVDAVVSHQWGHEQNYLHLDVLYGGHPLIHNAPWLASAGYYYPDFQAEAAARQLLNAMAHHAEGLPSYSQQSQRLIEQVSPTHPTNVQAHARLVLALWGNRLPPRRPA